MAATPKRSPGAGEGRKVIAENRKARHDFHILENFEAGLELKGTEVKSMRMNGCNIQEAYITISDGQAFVRGMNIAPHLQGNIHNHEPTRERRLLLHKREIEDMHVHITRKGNTIVPLTVYFLRGRAKIAIGIARGKQKIDKRQDIAARDVKRQLQRDMKERNY